MDMVVPAEGESPRDAFIKWRKWADDKVCCDYALKLEVQEGEDAYLNDLDDLVTPEVGINTFQLNMNGQHRLKDKDMMNVMDKIQRLGGLVMLNAENGAIVKENEAKV